MRNILILLTLFIVPYSVFSQPAKKNIVFLSVGKVKFTDVDNKNNFFVGVNYQNRFSNFFAWEIYYEYGQSRFTPSHTDVYIRNLNWNNADESLMVAQNIHFIYNNVLGAKIHASFVNNEKWFFSINIGVGYHFTQSGYFSLKEITTGIDGDYIILKDYHGDWIKKIVTRPVYRLGLQMHYTILKDWIVGFDANLTKQIDNIEVYINHPPIMDNYKVGIIVGKKF